MKKLRLSILLAVVLAVGLLATAPAASAQATGAIEGRVSDSQQLALPQPAVELLNTQGNSLQRIVGDGSGRYRFTALAPGSYVLRFSRTGFETATLGPVTVAAGQTVAFDAVLRPQQVVQTVTVTAALEDDRLVATKTDIPLLETPATVQTVPLELIHLQAATDLVSVINNIPSAYARTQYGVYNYYTFRGFELSKDPGSAILLNGLRIEGNRVNSQVNSIESVQVLKGPASMLYGTEATGGTINIVQKKPLATPLFEVALHGGRWATAGIELGATGPIREGSLLYRFDTAFEHSEGFRGAGFDRMNFSPALFWRISPRDQLDLRITYNQDRYDLDAGIPLFNGAIPDVPRSRRYNTPGNFEKASDPIFQTFYQRSLTESVRFRQAFQFQYRGDEYFQSEGLTVDPDLVDPNCTVCVVRENLYFNHFDRSYVSQSDLMADFDLLWRHQFLVGYEYDRLSHTTRRSAEASGAEMPPIDLFNPVETATPVTSFPVSRYDRSRNQSHAIYFQDYVRLHPKLQFLFGGRYDAYDRRTQRGTAPVVAFEQNPFTYRVALNAQLLPQFSLYSSYGTSFMAQTGLAITGEPLDPETGSQFEVGSRLNFFQNRLTVEASVFHVVQENIVVFRTFDDFDQGGRQYSDGFEIEVRGRASQRFSVFGSYGYTRAKFDDFGFVFEDEEGDPLFVSLAGNTPPHVPRHTARVWTVFDLPRGFGASLGGYYASRRATDAFNTFFMGGYATWDTAFFYNRDKMEYRVNVKNILNRKNYFVSSIIWNDVQVYPGPPLDVSGTVLFRF